ncbi:MAG: hypothetical protein OXL40_08070 [Bacteroidota bacterium]|nr:hypothetical protein [Bacteroidota bacterium]
MPLSVRQQELPTFTNRREQVIGPRRSSQPDIGRSLSSANRHAAPASKLRYHRAGPGVNVYSRLALPSAWRESAERMIRRWLMVGVVQRLNRTNGRVLQIVVLR